MTKISGIYQTPDGETGSGLAIHFYRLSSEYNSPGPKEQSVTTGEDGAYSIVLTPGDYAVSIVGESVSYSLGEIVVNEDSLAGSLEDYLFADTDDGSDSSDGTQTVQAQRQPPNLTSIPVMEQPPQVTLSTGSGILSVAPVSGGNGYKFGDLLTVEGGDRSIPAVLRVNAVDGSGAVTNASPKVPGIYSTKPANPASVTGGTGTGATFNLTLNGGIGSSIYVGTQISRVDESSFFYTGYSPKDITAGYRGNGVQNGTQMVVEFMSDAPQIDLRLISVNTACDLYVNGQRVSADAIKTDSSGVPCIYTVDWSGVEEIRHYRLCGVNSAFGGVIIPAGYEVWVPDGIRLPFAWQMGDSYTFGTGASQGSYNDFHVMCDALGFDGLADGIGGAGWTSVQDGRIPQQRVEMKLGSITRVPDYVFLSLGYNDAPANHIDMLKKNFTAAVEKVRELCPKAKIICIGPATPKGSTPELDEIRATEIELCEALKIPFIDVDNWINSTNCTRFTGADDTHPNDAGHVHRGIRLAQAVSAIL